MKKVSSFGTFCPRVFRNLVLLACCSLFVGTESRAAILAYDGFNYTGTVAGQNGGVGWTGSWAQGSTGTAASSFVTGLTLSDYSVGGNAVSFSLSRVTGTTNLALGRQFGVDNGSATTIYSSYLVSLNTDAQGTEIESRINISANSTNTATSIFRQSAKRNASFRSGISAGTDAVTQTASSDIYDGTTYLVISRLSNVGTGPTQEGKLWLLSAANYDAFKTGALTETRLDSNSLRSVTSAASGTSLDFTTSQFAQFGASVSTDNTTLNVVVDEMKYFTSLNDFNVIPEPSTYALLGLGGALLWILSRHNRRSP